MALINLCKMFETGNDRLLRVVKKQYHSFEGGAAKEPPEGKLLLDPGGLLLDGGLGAVVIDQAGVHVVSVVAEQGASLVLVVLLGLEEVEEFFLFEEVV